MPNAIAQRKAFFFPLALAFPFGRRLRIAYFHQVVREATLERLSERLEVV